MTDTDLLRGLLEQAAPTRPDVDPTSRAAAVVRRGRNARVRDRALVTVAAVSAVAVVVAIPHMGGDGGPDRVTPAPPTVQVESCPDLPLDVTKLGSVAVPPGVVSVRSCPVSGPGDPLPTEPLTGAAAQAFAKDISELPENQLPSFCMTTTVMLEPWALQLQGADGEIVTIGSTVRSCNSVPVDGAFRDVAQVLAAFQGNLERQQAGTPELACPTGDRLADGAPTWNTSFNPAEAKSGVICYRKDPMRARAYPHDAGTLNAEQLATIRDDLVAHLSAPRDGQCTDTGPQRLLVLENPQGDQAAFVDEKCIGEFAGARGYWTPSNASEDAIAAALGDPVRR